MSLFQVKNKSQWFCNDFIVGLTKELSSLEQARLSLPANKTEPRTAPVYGSRRHRDYNVRGLRTVKMNALGSFLAKF